ncbi:hypothetical protein B6N13_09100 [Marinomonas sp. UCMA 3892]|nr:hypothetical protein [Marinomonas sp. UCMA 3892]
MFEDVSLTKRTIHALRYNERRQQSCAYDENQALKILKRIFGYFLGASKKLPAQQSGKKVGNTKRLNGTWIPRRAKAATHNESFAFNGTLRCAYDALRLAREL